jgi:hypothetical protein
VLQHGVMRYIITHTTNAHWESGAIPDQALIDRVVDVLGSMQSAGVLLGEEGLGPSAEGVRLRFTGGERTIIPGPLKAENELAAGYSILRVRSIEEAIEWATRQARISGATDVDIRVLHEPWDVGMAQRPYDLPTRRYMVVRKATRETEAGAALPEEARGALSRLIRETTDRGVHLVSESMVPSRLGRRCLNTADGLTFYDGPFTETKELLGGFVIVSASSLDEACRWVPRYLEALGDTSVEVRPLQD